VSFLSHLYDFRTVLGPLGLQKKYYEEMINLADIKKGDKILDIGCGTGLLGLLLKERFDDSIDFWGIDTKLYFLKAARKKAKQKGAVLKLQSGCVENIPVKTESFDFVFCTLVFHHLNPDRLNAGLKEIKRILKPNAKLIIFDYCPPQSFSHYGLVIITYLWTSIIEYGKYLFQGKLPFLLNEKGFANVEIISLSKVWPLAIYKTKKSREERPKKGKD